MSCDRVVIAQTSSQGGKTTVGWIKYAMADLTGYLILLVQEERPTYFEAKPTATSMTFKFSPTQDCQVWVIPKNADGPVNSKQSAPVPVPFPPTPVDPGSNRPLIVRACVEAATVTVNWVPSTLEGLQGHYVTIVQDSTSFTNFQVEGGDVAVYTVDYTLQKGSSYQIIVTPYDRFGLDYRAASYPAPIPYPP